MSGWLETLSADAATDPKRRRSCILLRVSGGPSQMDTFDLKPGHANGGPFREISTSLPGIRISKHLPKLAQHMDRLVLVRSMTSKEGDHDLANFETVCDLSQILDAGWATLMGDLKERGLLESTLIVWMGEFGRTPTINGDKGRDHYPGACTGVLGGGGITGRQVIAKTSAGGETIEQRPVSVPDLLATVCLALGIDPTKSNQSNVGRPISLVDKAGRPLEDIVASR
jgi:arylsulfatase A-like enzyme